MQGKESRAVREELPGFVTLYDDGSVQRHESSDIIPSHEAYVEGVAATDVTLDETTGLWARIFLPEAETDAQAKLPVVLYFHGGGFCIGSPAWKMFHGLCARMAVATGSIWVSVGYRLAPEHRLPVGCDDCVAALAWLDGVAGGGGNALCEPITRHADFRRCFLAGDSAGGNLAHRVAVSHVEGGQRAVRVLGVILMHPGFVKEERSRSEMENRPDLALVSMEAVEIGSRLALPEGTDKDYFVMNPPVPNVRVPPVLVIVGKMDIFSDRQVEYCRAMKDGGQDLEVVEYPDMGHCFISYPQYENCPEALDLLQKVVGFMKRCECDSTV